MKKVVCLVLGVLMVMSLFSVFSASGAVTVRFWAVASPLRDNARRIIWKNFEEKNPGIKVDFEGIPFGAFNEKILTAAAAGTLPDACRYAFAPRFASKGLLMPLEEFIEGPDGIDTSLYMDGLFPNAAITWDDIVYALPFAWAMAPGYFYNADILREEGLTPPTNWAELATAVEKMTQKEADGTVTRDGMVMMSVLTDGFLLLNGALVTDAIGQSATKANYSAPEIVEALEFLVGLVNGGYLRMSGAWGSESKFFIEGRTGILATVGSNSYGWRPQTHPKFNWGTLMPPMNEGKEQVIPAEYGDCGFMFASTKNPDEAWKVLKAHCGREGSALIWTQKFGSLPPFKDILDPATDNPYYYLYQMEAHLIEIVQAALSGKSVEGFLGNWHPAGDEIWGIEDREYGLLYAGKQTVAETVANLDEKINALGF